jgi:hypothetical protein
MSRFFASVVILTILTAFKLPAQESFPAFDLPLPGGGKLLNTRTFNGPSLFGYMDGGAELYLEYGFSGAMICELGYDGEKIKAEIFKMKGVEEAFGIYSVSKFNCKSDPLTARYACQTKYQLQFCKGPYYVSIISGGGTSADSVRMITIANEISGKIADPEINLKEYLPSASDEEIRHDCVLVKGKLGIVNGAPDLEDYFAGISGYTALIVKKPGERIILVRFGDSESEDKFLELHKWGILRPEEGTRQMPGGERVQLLQKDHLYIIIPD